MFVQSDAVAEQGGDRTQPGVWEPEKKGWQLEIWSQSEELVGSKTVGSHSRQRLPIESQCPGPEGANRAPQEARWTL